MNAPTEGHPLDNPPSHTPNAAERALLGFERAFLALIALMTLAAAAFEMLRVWRQGEVVLADILLMFLYTEVIGMVAVFYSAKSSPFVYPIFIAITALARLIVLQGKNMAPENIVFEASAILLLAVAAVIIVRSGRQTG
ncbi:MAG: phosphate-starvation-inducible PsiE family protein [Sphingomonadaceae bacterium]|nr:phosphate-starvation-inducible PsiE family protein [Sphingomonadaceae bacterium]